MVINSKLEKLDKNKLDLESMLQQYDSFGEWKSENEKVNLELLGTIKVYHKLREDLVKLRNDNDLIAYQDEMIKSIANQLNILNSVNSDLIKELNYVNKIREINKVIQEGKEPLPEIINEVTNTYYLRIGHDILLTEKKIQEYESIYKFLKGNLEGENEVFFKIKEYTKQCTKLLEKINTLKSWIKDEKLELNHTPPIPFDSGVRSAGILAATIYNEFYSNQL